MSPPYSVGSGGRKVLGEKPFSRTILGVGGERKRGGRLLMQAWTNFSGDDDDDDERGDEGCLLIGEEQPKASVPWALD